MTLPLSSELTEMLRAGWEVKGFQQIMDIDGNDEAVASQTVGYGILLQQESKMAIATVHYKKGALSLTSIAMLTE